MNDNEKIKLCIENIEKTIPINVSSNDTTLDQASTPLLRACTREINKLLLEDIHLSSLSLCVRNLFELYLILKHISTDGKALENWFGQFYKDQKDVSDGFIALGKKNGFDMSEAENIQGLLDVSFDATQFKSKGGFNIRNLAEKYDSLEDYQAVHKLCSKLVHPSSMSVNGFEALSQDNVYSDMLFGIGLNFCLQIEEFSRKRLGSTSC